MKICIWIGYVLLKAAEINSCVCVCVFYTGPISPPEAETYSTAWVSAIRTHRQRRKGALSWEQTKADTACCRGSCEKEPREQVMCTKIWMQGSYNIQNSFFNTIWSSGDQKKKKTISKEQGKTKTHPISNNKIRLYLPKFLDSAKWEKMYCSKNVETSSLTYLLPVCFQTYRSTSAGIFMFLLLLSLPQSSIGMHLKLILTSALWLHSSSGSNHSPWLFWCNPVISPGEHTQYISVHLCREGVHQQSTQTTEDTTCYLPTQTVELADCKGIFSIALSKFDLEPSWPRKCETSQRSSHRVAFQSRTVL